MFLDILVPAGQSRNSLQCQGGGSAYYDVTGILGSVVNSTFFEEAGSQGIYVTIYVFASRRAIDGETRFGRPQAQGPERVQLAVVLVYILRYAWAAMLLDRNAPGARERRAPGRAEAEQLGMAREPVRFERLTAQR